MAPALRGPTCANGRLWFRQWGGRALTLGAGRSVDALGAEAIHGGLLIAVVREQDADSRHVQQFLNFRAGIDDSHGAFIPDEVRIATHQLAEAGAVNPRDAAEVDNDAGIALFENFTA